MNSAHPPYDANFAECIFGGVGCTSSAGKFFFSVKVVVSFKSRPVSNLLTYLVKPGMFYKP